MCRCHRSLKVIDQLLEKSQFKNQRCFWSCLNFSCVNNDQFRFRISWLWKQKWRNFFKHMTLVYRLRLFFQVPAGNLTENTFRKQMKRTWTSDEVPNNNMKIYCLLFSYEFVKQLYRLIVYFVFIRRQLCFNACSLAMQIKWIRHDTGIFSRHGKKHGHKLHWN